MSFKELGIEPWLIDALKSLSIQKPTEIQCAVIKPILDGKNVIAAAKTGNFDE
jgi:superfamily II DNA/RNA helicase